MASQPHPEGRGKVTWPIHRPRALRVGGGSGARALLSRRGVRIALGVLWIFDGLLQAEPAKFDHGYPLGDLAQSAMGEPTALSHSIVVGIQPFVAHWPWWNLGAVLVEVAVGAALVSGRLVRAALAVSVFWAALVWWLGEGFGMLASGFAMMLGGAPGPAVLYAALALLAWPVADHRDVPARGWLAVWGVLWLGGAALPLAFRFSAGQVIRANLAENALGQPHLLRDASGWLFHLAAHDGLAISAVLTAVQAAVGLGVLSGRGRRGWLTLGVIFSLFAWVVGQDLGGVLTSGANDPGLGPLVVVLAFAGWPKRDPAAAGASVPDESGAHRLDLPVVARPG
ncbi:MAG: hypothetical protein ACYC1D_12050 [Acidimicrobiales bacterium]